MIQQVTATDGVRLAMVEDGDRAAPTIICLHGYPDNRTVWAPVASRLAERFHVVTYDTRGAGESDAARSRTAYQLDQLEADLVHIVDAVSPSSPVHLIGHDWGSVQAWHAVTGDRLAGRIASFTSISGPCLDHVAHWFGRVRHHPTPASVGLRILQLVMSGYIGFFQLPKLPELAWRTGIMPGIIELLNRFDSGITDTAQHRPRVADGIHGLELYRANMPKTLRKPRRRHTRVPIQILLPTRDPFVSPAMQQSAHQWAPQTLLRRVPGGHWLPLSAPDTVAEHSVELIDKTSGADPPR